MYFISLNFFIGMLTLLYIYVLPAKIKFKHHLKKYNQKIYMKVETSLSFFSIIDERKRGKLLFIIFLIVFFWIMLDKEIDKPSNKASGRIQKLEQKLEY